MHRLVKHPHVDRDVEEAARWYHHRDPQVAFRFVEETRTAMRTAAASPLHYAIRSDGVRRVRVRRFPHSVFFVDAGDTVFVLAVLHGARQVEKLVQARTRWPGEDDPPLAK